MSKVIILGGGMAGLSAAHELIRRDFEVHIYEMGSVPGGKCRTLYPPTWDNVPGEHGFRYFPGFYQHLPATMAEIPYGFEGKSCFDNLVSAPVADMAQYGKLPVRLPAGLPNTLAEFRDLLADFGASLGVTLAESEFFAERIWQIATSCKERRETEYEKLNWNEYLQGDRFSPAYRTFFVHAMCRSLAAADPLHASARTMGQTQVHLLFHALSLTMPLDRVLNGPTSPMLLDPWLFDLEERGVVFHRSTRVVGIDMAGGLVSGVRLDEGGPVEGDYYIGALPVEVMAGFITADMTAVDPGLAGVQWLRDKPRSMNGIQFYLREDVRLTHGHALYVGSPWALTSISQRQFWPTTDLGRIGGTPVGGILSLCISEFDVPGLFIQKPASACTAQEVIDEVWWEMGQCLNVGGQQVLTDSNRLGVFLDPALTLPSQGRPYNTEPLFINEPDTLRVRPEAQSRILNFLLASDYVRTNTDVATMEAANEAARRAVNAILLSAGSGHPPCKIYGMDMPLWLEPLRLWDLARFKRNEPWIPVVL